MREFWWRLQYAYHMQQLVGCSWDMAWGESRLACFWQGCVTDPREAVIEDLRDWI